MAYEHYQQLPKVIRNVIVQRDISKFWTLIFKQKFDVVNDTLVIRFAGEAAADAGGPFNEFLTLCMKRFSAAPGLFFGHVNSLCFKAVPEDLMEERCFKIGQLTGLSILHSGRGPESLHPLIIKAIYDMPLDTTTSVEDAQLSSKLEKIDNNETDDLFEHNISPSEDKEHDKHLFTVSFVVFTKYQAIDQFRKGMKSVSSALVEPRNYTRMKDYLEYSKVEITLTKFLSLIKFNRDCDIGSNKWNVIDSAICDFEIYLAAVANGDCAGISLHDLLFFITGLDRVPPYGLNQLINVFFDENAVLPKVSTCSFIMTLPVNDIASSMNTALSYGGGFGEI